MDCRGAIRLAGVSNQQFPISRLGVPESQGGFLARLRDRSCSQPLLFCFVLSSIKRVLQGRLDGLDLAPLCADILRMEI